MSDHPKQPKPNQRGERNDERCKNTQKRTLAPSPQPSQSAMQAPSIGEESPPGATAVLPADAESSLRRADNREDSVKRGDTAKTQKSDTVQSMPVEPTYSSSTVIHLAVHGGNGGPGGQGGEHGGRGGTGEGPNITFPNSTVYQADPDAARIQSIKEKLANHVAAQHKFTDQSKSLCAPGTRVEIQADILKWLSSKPGTKEHIFWITGIAGSGKSTLSATLVDNLRKKGTPVTAQFFISRNIPETTNPDKIIPTIAQQLAEFSPVAAHIIHEKLKNGFPPSRHEQVEALLLAPIRELSKSRNMVIILVDALDELENAADSVKEILESIAPKDCCYLLDNVRLVITSRPEHWADISRSKTLELAMFRQHPLMTDLSVSEVHNFIVVRMKQITRWNDWPSDNDVQKLSDKADGLFHYATTALHWIEEQIRNRGTASREQVFENFTQMGVGRLGDLYRLILISLENIDGPAQHTDWRASQLQGFQHVIGTILVLHEPLTIHQIIALVADIPRHKFDVPHLLEQMCSVLIPGTTTSFGEATPQMHKSFRDYIMGVHAPAEFRILIGHAHFVTARSCLEVIVKAGSQSNVVVRYSVQHWHKHLRTAVEGGMPCEDDKLWTLLGQLVKEPVVEVWKANSWQVFFDVAAVGWQLLQQGPDEYRIDGIENIVMKAKDLRLELEREEERARLALEERRERLTALEWAEGQTRKWLLEREELEALEWAERTRQQEEKRLLDEELKRRIPFRKIWKHGLLKTWKHSHPPILKHLTQCLVT